MSEIKQFLRSHPIFTTLLMMLVVSFIILFIVFMLIKVYVRQGQEYELPDMVGLNLNELVSDSEMRLDYVVIDSIFQAGTEGGLILTQDPKAGTMVKRGRKVYLTITATTPGDAVVSVLIDMTLRQAISQLESEGLQGGRLTFVESPFRNAVLEQTYKGKVISKGDNLPRGSYVDLTVGLGNDVTTSVPPFVIGKTASQARRDILSASLNVGKEHFGRIKDKSHAVVVRQNPDYTGVTRYPFGTAVDLWYGDASEVDVDKMIRDFKVDSSQIVNEEESVQAIFEENEW